MFLSYVCCLSTHKVAYIIPPLSYCVSLFCCCCLCPSVCLSVSWCCVLCRSVIVIVTRLSFSFALYISFCAWLIGWWHIMPVNIRPTINTRPLPLHSEAWLSVTPRPWSRGSVILNAVTYLCTYYEWQTHTSLYRTLTDIRSVGLVCFAVSSDVTT